MFTYVKYLQVLDYQVVKLLLNRDNRNFCLKMLGQFFYIVILYVQIWKIINRELYYK